MTTPENEPEIEEEYAGNPMLIVTCESKTEHADGTYTVEFSPFSIDDGLDPEDLQFEALDAFEDSEEPLIEEDERVMATLTLHNLTFEQANEYDLGELYEIPYPAPLNIQSIKI